MEASLTTAVRMPLAQAVVAILLLLAPRTIQATDEDLQVWPVARVNHALDEDWSLSFLTRGRFDDDVSHEKDVLVRPFVSWTLIDGVPLIDSLTVMAGYDYLHSFDGRSEHRAWQAAHHAVERGRFRFVHRIRLDERFVEDVDPTIFRLRYRLSTSRPISGSRCYALVSEEVFVNLNDDDEGPLDGFEQNRLRLGLGRRFFGRLRAEGGYEFQYARRRTDPDVFRHVFFLELSLETGARKGNEFIVAPRLDELPRTETP